MADVTSDMRRHGSVSVVSAGRSALTLIGVTAVGTFTYPDLRKAWLLAGLVVGLTIARSTSSALLVELEHLRRSYVVNRAMGFVTLGAALAALTAGCTTSTVGPVGTSGSMLAAGSTGGLWMSIGRTPRADEIRALAPRYSVVVLNAWDLDAKALIRQVNPAMVVLVYKDLASTRSYTGAVTAGADASKLPTGVGYVEAGLQPGWFAADGSGNRISWGPYPGHWQMSVWDTGYQRRWADNVVRALVDDDWDGVFADNDMRTLHWYSSALIAGTTDAASTDTKLQTGLQSLIDLAGPNVVARGKLFVPNVSDGRLDLTRWKAATAYGGAMEENFAHWGTSTGTGYVGDWGTTGWVDQTAQLSSPLTLAVTRAASGDTQLLRYGYASALVRATGRVAWTPSIVGNYSQPEWFSWQDVVLGAPAGAGGRQTSGAWSRVFTNAFVAVNPLATSATVAVPNGFGTNQITLAPHDAQLLTRW